MLIGMGGGAASSMATGANTADLDFDSVQRGNAEIQRRAQEVIDRCWQLGDANPILSIHDVGAGGLSNALPELVHGGGAGGALRPARRARPKSRAWRRARSGATRRRSATCSRSAPADLDRFRAICERERCPFAVVGAATADGAARRRRSAFRQPAGRHGARRAARQAAEDDARRRATVRARCRRSISPASRVAEAAYRVLQLPAGRRQDVPHHHRRSHRRRAVRARSDGRAVAGAGRRRRA